MNLVEVCPNPKRFGPTIGVVSAKIHGFLGRFALSEENQYNFLFAIPISRKLPIFSSAFLQEFAVES